MRPALQKLLASPSALSILRDVVQTGRYSACQRCIHAAVCQEQTRGPQDNETIGRSKVGQCPRDRNISWNYFGVKGVIEGPIEGFRKAGEPERHDSVGKTHGDVLQNYGTGCISSHTQNTSKKEWRKRLVTFEQFQHESNVEAPHTAGSLLIEDEQFAKDWKLWLELIRFRKRHHGAEGTVSLYNEIFRKNICMPTRGATGHELWKLLILAVHQDAKLLKAVIPYAIRVKDTTGEMWQEMYYCIIVHALKTDPTWAYDLHKQLVKHFPPLLADYQKLFRLSLTWDSIDAFEGLYSDWPISGMYSTVIPKLCELQDFTRALRWHFLLYTKNDYPRELYDIKPLLSHLARFGDYRQIEQIIRELNEASELLSSVPVRVETYIRKNKKMSREIFNHQLGEVHGIEPKHISDDFCARLFATKLFSVDTVIAGLQMMALETIGPLALREVAARNDCHHRSVLRHLKMLKDAGIVPDESAFSLLVQKLASTGEHRLLRSTVDSDLHPVNFEDQDLQERLLVQYYEIDDEVQFDRTLAAIIIRCRDQDLAKWRSNLILRCHITLRHQREVMSLLEAMKRENVPITARSSRHLRMCWLSRRNVGKGIAPDGTKELTIIINASISTMRSGRHVPIIAWREIMRRLGMAGRLEELEELALWLVDYYTSPLAQRSFPIQSLMTPKLDESTISNSHPRAFLTTLFTISAQHAIIAWGFQQEPKKVRRVRPVTRGLFSGPRKRPLWMWGLDLLRKLQERGVPIHQDSIAKICKIRLRVLFGHEVSRRRINRRTRVLNDARGSAMSQHSVRIYVKKMRKMWRDDIISKRTLQSLETERPRP